MVVMKMTHFKHIPDTCDDCIYYSCKPHPYKGWSDGCELCGHCMDDDQEDDWIYGGDSRPKNCPLLEIPTSSERDHKCHTCKHYTSGDHDGSCGSYICKGYSNWESEDKE